MKVNVGVSNRHVHLTEETYKILFQNKAIEKRNDLNQIGEYASTDTIDLVYNGKIIEHVRIIGPFRNYNQIELLGSDIEYLGIGAPVRKSGDLDDTPGIILVSEFNSVQVDHGVIRAERHLHIPTNMENTLNLHDGDKVILDTGKITFDAIVKISRNGFFEIHIDKDEAKQYGLKNGDEVELKDVENR